MPDFLLELLSEEIPARMQVQAAKDLERLVVGALSDRGLLFEAAQGFSGPRRLTLAITGLPVKQPDVSEEKKGPRVNAPEKAIEGFLRSAGVTLAQCEKRDDGKGEFYVAVIARKGRPTAEVLAEILPELLAKLPWPKSMRFPGSPVRWVRPLHSILATFDGEVVPFEFAGVQSGSTTRGHRFLSQGEIFARRFEDYEAALKAGHVILDPEERREIILHDAKQKAFALGLELIADEGLLNEVAGLAEWPVVLIGTIEDQFMDVPPEILQTSMRTHQKYFSLHDPKTGKMANRFAVVANMIAEDGGKEIVAGNERVLRARLSDAKFFWDQDRKRTLESRVDDLKKIVFHAKLGTQYERVERIESLAGEIAEKIGAGLAEGEREKLVGKAKRAARLSKADLTTGVVGEFPELQGVMGRYYALHNNEDAEVADAIRDHYKPVGPSDAVPSAPVSMAVALADKLDQLAGFFAIDEKPTGSSDPYALRRAALGVIRILVSNSVRLQLTNLIGAHVQKRVLPTVRGYANPQALELDDEIVVLEMLAFLADRLAVALSTDGLRVDCVRAVFHNTKDLKEHEIADGKVLYQNDDLVWMVAATRALQEFLKSEDGANLLTAYKRAANILKAEEKKDKTSYDGAPDPDALAQPEEKALFAELAVASDLIKAEIERERFVEAMGVMARLRGPVDAFFDKVTVNDKDAGLRRNRLLLLSRLRAVMHQVADFSKVEG
ncbi:MAG: glycine--tRNA ligase subunit beta [Alphaproteobacteria bacterium]|nr:glycine--tRNA ligase subunit beta [Alphaproteobacteria bacterium]